METPMGLGASAAMENPVITQTIGNEWYNGFGNQMIVVPRSFAVMFFALGISFSSLVKVWKLIFYREGGVTGPCISCMINGGLRILDFYFSVLYPINPYVRNIF